MFSNKIKKISKISKAGVRFCTNPDYRFLVFADAGFYNSMPDKEYLQKKYKASLGKELNLDNPQTFNEKLQWLKLYDRKPLYTSLVDKIEVKKYVTDVIGEEYIIPTLGVWDAPEEIDFNSLPDQFVLKCNHNSGMGMTICRNKAQLNIKKVKKELRNGLKEDKYLWGREWPYKNVRRRILAEQYMEDSNTNDLKDYKFFAFDGEVKSLFIATDRQEEGEETKFDFFDSQYNHLDFINGHPNAATVPKKPVNFEEMKKLAERLSKGFPHVRVDFTRLTGRSTLVN